jgi:polyhydroxyalkanoate synthesis regulator phasin
MELLKNFIYAGVGLASVTADKTKETIDDLVEKGMISDTEGKKLIDDFLESTSEK